MCMDLLKDLAKVRVKMHCRMPSAAQEAPLIARSAGSEEASCLSPFRTLCPAVPCKACKNKEHATRVE